MNVVYLLLSLVITISSSLGQISLQIKFIGLQGIIGVFKSSIYLLANLRA